MPRLNQTPTLKRLSLVTITYNWDLLGYSCRSQKEMSALIENNEFINKEGPFRQMPSSILEDLLQVIAERRTLSRKHLHLLCCEQLRSLNLGFGTCGEIYYALQFMKRTKKLEKLSLAYQQDVAPSIFMSLIPSLTSLTSINLQMTTAVDKILELIGIHCPNIIELILTQTMISDNGIRRLCVPTNQDEASLVRCPKLRKLGVNETQITWVGVHIALEHLKQLSELEFDKIFQVFQCLDPTSLPPDKQLKLKSLVSTSLSIIGDSIDAAAFMCPDVEIISISNAIICNETLYKFMQFEKLRSITIVNHEDMTLDFAEGILPLLQICGPILENLILDHFASIDLISLGRSCPKLRKLGLSRIVEYQLSSGEIVENLFNSLCALELWFDSRTEFMASTVLIQLLHSSTNLTDLLVKKCASCNIENMQRVWKTNPMKKLNRLTLDECVHVDWCLLDALLHMENDISVMRIWNCGQVTRNCKDLLTTYIDDHNLDVYLQWVE